MTAQTDFQTLLNNQLGQLTALEHLIDEEKAVLQKNSPDALVDISEKKNQLLVDIQELDQHFRQSPEFTAAKKAGQFADTLTAIEQTLLRCKEKNHVNGMVIQQSQLAVERMKTELLQQRNKSSVTYDSKGKTSGGLSSLGIKA
ncbi:flagella synthesis protein FlgN [Thalassotalea marina]|uniref:Flagellar protein FlgN n=1 Tax=Thalassotalea marina TaxID=1673741 RepID=A0A919BCS3_9GAMM|nr:flagellar protein FlgN [Thalassotalea marina]GHF80153.1 hypothetical protein GCM10017161_04250 [Thalassotalea marina]